MSKRPFQWRDRWFRLRPAVHSFSTPKARSDSATKASQFANTLAVRDAPDEPWRPYKGVVG